MTKTKQEKRGKQLMTRKEWNKLLEYNTSIPTGAVLGKRWRRNDPSGPMLGEFTESSKPGMLNVQMTPVLVTRTAIFEVE